MTPWVRNQQGNDLEPVWGKETGLDTNDWQGGITRGTKNNKEERWPQKWRTSTLGVEVLHQHAKFMLTDLVMVSRDRFQVVMEEVSVVCRVANFLECTLEDVSVRVKRLVMAKTKDEEELAKCRGDLAVLTGKANHYKQDLPVVTKERDKLCKELGETNQELDKEKSKTFQA